MRRLRHRPRVVWLLAALLVTVVAVRFFWGPPEAHRSDHVPLDEGIYRVVRVVDGDTIIVAAHQDGPALPAKLQDSQVRVRLLGIDAPETVKPNTPVKPWGPEATAFAETFLVGGTVQLRFDRRRVDQYGRTLAYVFVDEQMLNEELVRAGLARVDHYPGDSPTMGRRLRKAQQEAQKQHRGIWQSPRTSTVPRP